MLVSTEITSFFLTFSRQLGGSVMLGLGIWVTTQDTEYKHLAGNLVSRNFLQCSVCGNRIGNRRKDKWSRTVRGIV